jgi:hypothetical protein
LYFIYNGYMIEIDVTISEYPRPIDITRTLISIINLGKRKRSLL